MGRVTKGEGFGGLAGTGEPGEDGPGGTTYDSPRAEPELRPPHRILSYLASSIGAKQLMAVTGLVPWLYLLVHIAGNLQVFAGRERFNAYAAFLQGSAILLWGERLVVVGAIALHTWAALRVTALNRAARPVQYAYGRATETSTLMSRTMIVSGLVLLAFFVFHLLHFTVHAVGNATFALETLPDGHTRPDAWQMVESAFTRPAMVAVYVVGMVCLFGHLAHGALSGLQTLGGHRGFRSPAVARTFLALVVLLATAAIAIPVGIFVSR